MLDTDRWKMKPSLNVRVEYPSMSYSKNAVGPGRGCWYLGNQHAGKEGPRSIIFNIRHRLEQSSIMPNPSRPDLSSSLSAG